MKNSYNFYIPAEVLHKVSLIEDLFLDKILFTSDVEQVCETFKKSSDDLGELKSVRLFKTHSNNELFGIVQLPITKRVTRYYQYRFQYSNDADTFKLKSDVIRTVLFTNEKDLIIFTNNNDSQTMVIVKKGEKGKWL